MHLRLPRRGPSRDALRQLEAAHRADHARLAAEAEAEALRTQMRAARQRRYAAVPPTDLSSDGQAGGFERGGDCDPSDFGPDAGDSCGGDSD